MPHIQKFHPNQLIQSSEREKEEKMLTYIIPNFSSDKIVFLFRGGYERSTKTGRVKFVFISILSFT